MSKILAAVVLVLTVGCGADKTYLIDRVPIVLEQGIGPERIHLAMVIELYRQAARRFYGVESDRELWRSLTEIRYTRRAVEGGALYRGDTVSVYSNWFACALDVPLYTALVEHYSAELGSDTIDLDREWAAASRRAMRESVCSAVDKQPSIQFPW